MGSLATWLMANRPQMTWLVVQIAIFLPVMYYVTVFVVWI